MSWQIRARWIVVGMLVGSGCSGRTLIVGIVPSHTDAGPAAPQEASVREPLRVRITLREGPADDASLALRCRGSCVDLVASASGAEAPYAFTWQDGHSGPELHSCPEADTTLSVTASATGASASASLSVRVLDCTAAEAASGIEVCRLDGGIVLPEQVTADVVGQNSDPIGLQFPPVVYYAAGAALPAGRYRVEYATGCFNCCVTLLDSFFLVGEDPGTRLLTLPGGGSGDVLGAPVARCPASETPYAPIDFDFAGGKLGVWLSDTVAADNQNGDGAGGRSPTWRLTRLDCP